VSLSLRVVLVLLAAVVVVVTLFTVVFPWVERTFVTDPVLGTLVGALA
jgi:hypothetical protein